MKTTQQWLLTGSATLAAASLFLGATAQAAAPVEAPVAVAPAQLRVEAQGYWTSARMANAQAQGMGKVAMRPAVAGDDGGKYGAAVLDFTSSRINPISAAKVAPYKAVGKLFFTKPGVGDYVCSASVLRARLIVTAGHCVHSGNGQSSGYYTNFLFVPAWAGTSPGPLGNWNWGAAKVSDAWYVGNGTVPNAEDWAVIQLADDALGYKVAKYTGKFDYMIGRAGDNHLTMLGYPVAFDSGNTMHHCASSDYKDNGTNTMIYGCDMTGGASGGPWVQNLGVISAGQTGGSWAEANRVVGVNSYVSTDPSQMYMGASNFNQNFANLMTFMCGFTAGNC